MKNIDIAFDVYSDTPKGKDPDSDSPMACPPKVVPSVKLVVVQTARKREYDT